MATCFLRMIKRSCLIIIFTILIPTTHAIATQHETALSLHGDPKYQQGFTHFDYVNPDAPKGGSVRMADLGTFDSLNHYIEKGTSAAGIYLIYDSLMTHSYDEPFSRYPLIAKSVELAPDSSSITFHLNEKARFHDDHPITAEDILYTFNLLVNKGSPFYRTYYSGVKAVDILAPLTVRFTFHQSGNQELPLILTELPVLPKHFWEKPENNFETANLSIPLGSGPYRIASADAGKQITYQRVENYWAKDLPVNKGRHNIDSLRYDYYRDSNVAVEALKAGEYDIRFENTAKTWAQSYDIPAVNTGQLKKETFKTLSPEGMQGFAFNTRKGIFADRRVRKAIIYALDFEWLNRNLFYDSYYRANSYFSNSDMEATGLPSAEELKLLKPFQKELPPALFTQPYRLPVTDGSGNARQQLSEALNLLEQAGWTLDKGQLKNNKNEHFQFELLLASPAFERVALPFKKNLELMGIDVNIRTVDVSQYIHRLRSFDYDMIVSRIPQSSSPGNEQLEFWGSGSADTLGSKNYMGIKSPVIDNLIEKIIKAPTREELVTAVKALDRVLLWGEYIIPHWYLPELRVVYWHKLKHPDNKPLYSFDFETWWVTEEKATSPQSTDLSTPDKSTTHYPLIIFIGLAGLLLLVFLVRARRRKH